MAGWVALGLILPVYILGIVGVGKLYRLKKRQAKMLATIMQGVPSTPDAPAERPAPGEI